MKKVSLVVLIPIGPTCREDFIRDTLESVYYYTSNNRKIILVDDSMQGKSEMMQRLFPDVVVIQSNIDIKGRRSNGLLAGLYLTLSAGMVYAYENFEFEVLLRMDTDALVIGEKPEDDATSFFLNNPELGNIGSFRVDCRGIERDYSRVKQLLSESLSLIKLIKYPRTRLLSWLQWHRIYRKAEKNGYRNGDHCMGGASFYSYECIKRLYDNKLLNQDELRWVKLEEDQIFAILTYASGLKLGDFASGNHPMGVRHRGLPWHPEELLARGKKVTHSTRFFEALDENSIRRIFRDHRI